MLLNTEYGVFNNHKRNSISQTLVNMVGVTLKYLFIFSKLFENMLAQIKYN